MAKCLTCGTTNPDENFYCAKCGTQLQMGDQVAGAAAYEEAQKQFEQDALIGMNKDKIVYTCLLCGAVNRIENDVCSKCGKKRPRNEYIGALRRIQAGRAAQEEHVATQALPEARPAPIQPQDPQPEKQLTLYKYVEESKQLPQTVQPLVIVPYVNAEQPLWQYKPQQMYRFQPATQEERLAAQQAQAALQQAEAAARAAQIGGEIQRPDPSANITYNRKKKKVRVAAFFSMLISIAALVLMFLFDLVKNWTESIKGYNYFTKLYELIKDAIQNTPTQDQIRQIVTVAGVALVMVLLLVIAVVSFVRLIKGRAKHKGFVLPLIAFVFAVAAILAEAWGNLADSLATLAQTPAFYALLAAPLLLTILGLVCPKNIRRVNK